MDNEVTVLNDIKMEVNDDYDASYVDQSYASGSYTSAVWFGRFSRSEVGRR